MFVAAGQFVVSSVWEENAQVCVSLMAQAAGRGVSLLVLPEGILARNDIDLDLPIRAAQPLDGEFMTRLLEESAHNNMTTIFTILVPSTPGRAVNMLVRYGRVTLSRVTRSCISMMRFRCKNPKVLMPEPLSRLCWTWRGLRWGL